MRLKILALTGLLLGVVAPTQAQDDPLAIFDGVWVIDGTPPFRHIVFDRVGPRRIAALPFGEVSIRVFDERDGFTLRVTGHRFECYYRVYRIHSKKIEWLLRHGSSVCLKFMLFEKKYPP
jgi:hypothetical protein